MSRHGRHWRGTRDRIGPYRLVEVLGEGGMGVVFRAEQEGEIERVVALKLLKAELASEEVVARFEAERQALASMNHPGIATIHDAGCTEDGLPYFVMEHIDGSPITRASDERCLDLRRRLELFLQLCDAVEHAHRRGILHRDLKPSNVLVASGDNGELSVKVIDFGTGVALGVNDAAGRPHAGATSGGGPTGILGTLDYMSPEQAAPGPTRVDASSDVYSLGALLYELLAARTPLGLSASELSFEEMLRRIRERDPPPPSSAIRQLSEQSRGRIAAARAIGSSQLSGRLQGDLDWIAMKALAKEKRQRYSSAAELGEDVRRHLAGKPVLARPPSGLYRLRMYARRNAGLVTGALLVTLALSVGLALSLAFSRAARSARDEARARRAEVLRLKDIAVLSHLREDAGKLLIHTPGKRAAIDAWLERARGLADRGGVHRETLRRLRRLARRAAVENEKPSSGRARSPPEPASAAPAAGLDEIAIRWQIDILEELVEGLEELASPDPSRAGIGAVQAWRELAPSEEEIARQWRQACASIADRTRCPEYRGLEISRPERLVPLSRNPTSGLWELVDAATGLLPRRKASGGWKIAPETGIVFVLVPGGTFVMGSPPEERWRVKERYRPSGTKVEVLLWERIGLLALRWLREVTTRFPVLGVKTRRALEHWVALALFPGPGDEWRREVTLSPFFIAKHELPQPVWNRFMPTRPSMFRTAGLSSTDHYYCPGAPTNTVTWNECRAFCRSAGLRLPTEAQWEYACRGGRSGPFGNDGPIEAFAWCLPQGPHASAEKAPNRFGLFDMHGNFQEACRDLYDPEFYARAEAAGPDPVCLSPAGKRVVRGGGFGSAPWRCRCAARRKVDPDFRSDRLSLRPVLELAP